MSIGEMSVPRGVSVRSPVYRCCQQKSSRSTSCVTHSTVERVVDDCTKFITHWSLWVTKKFVDWIKNEWLSWPRPLSYRNPISQHSSVPIGLQILISRSRTLRNTWPRTSTENHKQFRQLESSKVIKNGAIRQITHDFLFDFQSKYKCLSHAISEILRDEKRYRFSQKNWLPCRSSTAKVLPSLQIS